MALFSEDQQAVAPGKDLGDLTEGGRPSSLNQIPRLKAPSLQGSLIHKHRRVPVAPLKEVGHSFSEAGPFPGRRRLTGQRGEDRIPGQGKDNIPSLAEGSQRMTEGFAGLDAPVGPTVQ